jgi:plastocyanin
MVLLYIGASTLRLYRRLSRASLATIPPPSRTNRSAKQPMPVARSLPRLLPLAVAVALLGAGLVLAAGGPAAAQAAPNRETIEGTNYKWDPASVTIRPGGTVTFRIAGGAIHPVKSGDGSDLNGDGRFDDSGCGADKMAAVGDSCQVKFPKAGTFPFFCQTHVAQGMKGTIQVGAGGGATTTTAGGEAGGSVVEPPSAAAPPSAGRPVIYWAGWALFALGALLALALIALYVRFAPHFDRPKS